MPEFLAAKFYLSWDLLVKSEKAQLRGPGAKKAIVKSSQKLLVVVLDY